MTLSLKPIAASLRVTNSILAISLQDLKAEDAGRRVRQGEGPSIAWQAGHMLEFRGKMLGLLGVAASGTPASLEDVWDLARFMTEWTEMDARLMARLEAATEEQLDRTIESGVHGEQTTLERLVFLVWHEAVHIGGITSIRKELGYPAPAELVRAKAAARSGS